MVYSYMVCLTCVLIEQLVPVRPPKKLKWRRPSINGDGLPLVTLFSYKNTSISAPPPPLQYSASTSKQVDLPSRYSTSPIVIEVMVDLSREMS